MILIPEFGGVETGELGFWGQPGLQNETLSQNNQGGAEEEVLEEAEEEEEEGGRRRRKKRGREW